VSDSQPTTPRHLRIATRGSRLALWQANFVADILQKAGATTELVVCKTMGDQVQDRMLYEIGGKGLFIKELEQAMLDGRADLAVHSLKDMPVSIPPGFSLAAVMARHSPADCLILPLGVATPKKIFSAADLRQLPIKSVGTGSLRRGHLLQRYCPDWQVTPIRGNVDTRLAKLAAGEFDALLLANASVERLALAGHSYCVLDATWFTPCAGQGALAIETRDAEVTDFVHAQLSCQETSTATEIERAVLKLLGGDCTMPFGCYARIVDVQWVVDTIVLAADGEAAQSRLLFAQSDTAASCAEKVFADLKSKGVEKILRELHKPAARP